MLFLFAATGERVIQPRLVSSDCISVTLSQPSTAKKTETNPQVQPLQKEAVIPPKKQLEKKVIQKQLPTSITKREQQPKVIKPLTRKKCLPVQAKVVDNQEARKEGVSSHTSVAKSNDIVEAQDTQVPALSNAETSNSVVEAKPLYRDNPKPQYPALAQRRGWQGTVILAVSVLAGGETDHVRIHKSCGYSLLDKSAIKAVETWSFLPGTKDGLPVLMEVLIPVHFLLTK